MTLWATPGSPITAVAVLEDTGLTGTATVRILDASTGLDILAPTTAGITEQPAGSSIYTVPLTSPDTLGYSYLIIWDDGSGSDKVEELIVTYTLPTGAASTPYLCTIDDVKLALGFESDSTSRDAQITDLLPTATRLLEAHAKRNFTNPATLTKRLASRYGFLALPDLQAGEDYTITRVRDTTLLVEETDYQLEPVGPEYGVYTYALVHECGAYNPLAARHARRRYHARELVDVTGTFGFPTVPELAKRAAVAAIGAWVSKGVVAMRGQDDGQGAPVSPTATWTLPYAAKDIISDLTLKSVA